MEQESNAKKARKQNQAGFRQATALGRLAVCPPKPIQWLPEYSQPVMSVPGMRCLSPRHYPAGAWRTRAWQNHRWEQMNKDFGARTHVAISVAAGRFPEWAFRSPRESGPERWLSVLMRMNQWL